jgi:hypothetical protein
VTGSVHNKLTGHLQHLLRAQAGLMTDLCTAYRDHDDKRVLALRTELDAIAAAATRLTTPQPTAPAVAEQPQSTG